VTSNNALMLPSYVARPQRCAVADGPTRGDEQVSAVGGSPLDHGQAEGSSAVRAGAAVICAAT
jgi:hypothetical protein